MSSFSFFSGQAAQFRIPQIVQSASYVERDALQNFSASLSSTPINGNTLVAFVASNGSNNDTAVTGITGGGVNWVLEDSGSTGNLNLDLWIGKKVLNGGSLVDLTQSNGDDTVGVVFYELDTVSSIPVESLEIGGGFGANFAELTASSEGNSCLCIFSVAVANGNQDLGTPTGNYMQTFSFNSTGGSQHLSMGSSFLSQSEPGSTSTSLEWFSFSSQVCMLALFKS